MKRRTKTKKGVALACAMSTVLIATQGNIVCSAVDYNAYNGDNITYASENTQITRSTPNRGDVNYDGQIDAADASLTLSIYSTNSVGGYIYSREADVDGDKCVDASDASTILALYAELSTCGYPENYIRQEVLYSKKVDIYQKIGDAKPYEQMKQFSIFYVLNDCDSNWSEIISAKSGERGYVKKEVGFDTDILVNRAVPPENFMTMEKFVGERAALMDDVDGPAGISKVELKNGDIFYMTTWFTNGLSKIYFNGKSYYLKRDAEGFASTVLASNWNNATNPPTTTKVPATTNASTTKVQATVQTTVTTQKITTKVQATVQTTATEQTSTTTQQATTNKPTTMQTAATTSVTTEAAAVTNNIVLYYAYLDDGEPWKIRSSTEIISKDLPENNIVGQVSHNEVFEVLGDVAVDWYKVKKYNDDDTITEGNIYISKADIENKSFVRITKSEYDDVVYNGKVIDFEKLYKTSAVTTISTAATTDVNVTSTTTTLVTTDATVTSTTTNTTVTSTATISTTVTKPYKYQYKEKLVSKSWPLWPTPGEEGEPDELVCGEKFYLRKYEYGWFEVTTEFGRKGYMRKNSGYESILLDDTTFPDNYQPGVEPPLFSSYNQLENEGWCVWDEMELGDGVNQKPIAYLSKGDKFYTLAKYGDGWWKITDINRSVNGYISTNTDEFKVTQIRGEKSLEEHLQTIL